MPGKLWTHEEKQLLRRLWKSGVDDPKMLAEKIDRSPGAILEKVKRMGLRVVVSSPRKITTPARHFIPCTLRNNV